MRWFTLIISILIIVLGYGFWHVRTHGTINISIYDITSDNNYTRVKGVSIKLKDSKNELLATGDSENKFGIVYLIHPETGSCYEKEQNAYFSGGGRTAWQECFAQQSTWLMQWVRDIRFADILINNCLIENTPVELNEYPGDWWLWWIPLPHVGGKPYTYYKIEFHVDPLSCEIRE